MKNIRTDEMFVSGDIYDLPGGSKMAIEMASVADTADIFDDNGTVTPVTLPGALSKYQYIPWGEDNELPYHIMDLIGKDEVMSQNKHFNILTCYGAGTTYRDIATKQKTQNKEIQRFMIRNFFPKFSLEQATDMKFFFFAIAVVILDKEGKKIVKIRHKDACNCRFEKSDKNGKINHVFYANWRKQVTEQNVEVIQLLDETDPWGELEMLMGREPGPDGESFPRTNLRKFAIVCKFPTSGCPYYPHPYYSAIFRGDWYVIKQLIAKGKKAKIRNHAGIKFQVEVHRDYWLNLCKEEEITDPIKIKERIKKEKENIKQFVTGIENSGKLWITGFYQDPNGKETRMVRINSIESNKEGGDWSEDIQEAANMACYADNIHPNMVGAVPGKAQTNNSGSDKRELFTLKQSIETPYHDIMSLPHIVILGYNNWIDEVEMDVPIITLTTLDKNKDAEKSSVKKESDDL